jgi:hypothetical protein
MAVALSEALAVKRISAVLPTRVAVRCWIEASVLALKAATISAAMSAADVAVVAFEMVIPFTTSV